MDHTLDKRAVIEAIRAEFESARGSRIWTDYVNALRLVSQVVFTRSSGFVLEFIQNAEDAGKGQSGSGEVSIPQAPVVYLVRDPDKIGDRDKLTVRTADWKGCLLTQP